MRPIKQVNRENRENYFFNDLTNIKDVDPGLLNTDQVSFESNKLIIYDIKYVKDLNISNSLYLVFNTLDAYIEKSGENKYLIFASTDKNGKALESYTEVWGEIKEEIELIIREKLNKYGKDFMKIKF